MEEKSGALVANGRPGIGVRVVLPEAVYRQLLHDARANVPASTVGALIGAAQREDAQDQIVVTEVVPLARVPDQATRLVQGKAEWDKLQARFSDDSPARLVGWFYADPGLAIFPPRLDLAATHQELAPAGGLLLVVNPSTFAGDGACYLWRGGRFIAAGGFAEDRSDPAAPAIVAWNGEGARAASLGPSPPESGAGVPGPAPAAAPPASPLWTPEHSPAAPRGDVPIAPGARPAGGARGVLGWAMAGLLILLGGWALWSTGLPARILSPAEAPARPPASAVTPPGLASPTRLAAVNGLALSPAPPAATPATAVPAAPPARTPAPPAMLPATAPPVATLPPTAVRAATAAPLPPAATLAPPTVAPTATPGLPGIVVGGGLQVAPSVVLSVNVRAAPASTARVIGSLLPGGIGRVVAGPRVVNGDTWWQIRGWDARSTLGWVLGKYVQAVP